MWGMGRSYTVADIMTEHVVTVSEEDSLEQVTQNLDRFRFRHLPVVDGRKVVGVITERDLLRFAVSVTEVGPAASAKAVDLERNTFVAQVMTRNPITVPATRSTPGPGPSTRTGTGRPWSRR